MVNLKWILVRKGADGLDPDEWESFLTPYHQAVGELKLKFRELRNQMLTTTKHVPIEFVTGRVKPIESIKEKMVRRHVTVDRLAEDMEDIAGLRIMCQFVEDIYQVVALIKQRHDLTVVQERDYIQNAKASGYRSYHVVCTYPLQCYDGEKSVQVEIQVRTLAMNFWATIEHSLKYKYQGNLPAETKQRLQRAAEAAFLLDNEMSSIREDIQEAQHAFEHRQDRR